MIIYYPKEKVKRLKELYSEVEKGNIVVITPNSSSSFEGVAIKLYYIKTTTDLPWSVLARIIDVDVKTLIRWKKGENTPRGKNKEFIENLYELVKAMEEVLSQKEVKVYIRKYNPKFKKAPLEMLLEKKWFPLYKAFLSIVEGLPH